MLTDDEWAELTALRARAYGPEADLFEDPSRLARLVELERRAHGAAPGPDTSNPDAAVPVSTGPASAGPAFAARASAAPAFAARASAEPASTGPASAAPAFAARASAEPAFGDASAGPRPSGWPEPPGVPASTDRSTSMPPSSPDAAAPLIQPRPPRRTWTRRAVLLVGIPVIAVACAAGAGVGAAAARTAGTPAPNTTLAAGYAATTHAISEMQTWDAGSPRLVADLRGALVWDGTTAGGLVTCVVVKVDASLQPLSSCEATDLLATSGVGVTFADERTGVTHTYVAWPNGAPVVTYTSDDPNPSP